MADCRFKVEPILSWVPVSRDGTEHGVFITPENTEILEKIYLAAEISAMVVDKCHQIFERMSEDEIMSIWDEYTYHYNKLCALPTLSTLPKDMFLQNKNQRQYEADMSLIENRLHWKPHITEKTLEKNICIGDDGMQELKRVYSQMEKQMAEAQQALEKLYLLTISDNENLEKLKNGETVVVKLEDRAYIEHLKIIEHLMIFAYNLPCFGGVQ